MITIAIAEQKINEYLQAESDVLNGRTVTHNGRTLTMVDLPDIAKQRDYWIRTRDALRGKGGGGPGFVRFL